MGELQAPTGIVWKVWDLELNRLKLEPQLQHSLALSC